MMLEERAVGYPLGVGLDVVGFENGQGSFAGDGAVATVGGGDEGAERALAAALFEPGAAAVVDPVSAIWALRFTASRADRLDGTRVIA